jgi:hypothetical protein
MPVPRLRQLRRDKTLFGLVMNATRLHLEEADRLNYQPELRDAPDDTLQLIQYSIAQWAGIATDYVVRKYHCPTQQAMQLLGELLIDIRSGVAVHELRQVPFEVSLRLPPELLAQQLQQQQEQLQQQQEQPAAE